LTKLYQTMSLRGGGTTTKERQTFRSNPLNEIASLQNSPLAITIDYNLCQEL